MLREFLQFDDETILWSASLILLRKLATEQLAGRRVLGACVRCSASCAAMQEHVVAATLLPCRAELGSGLGHLGAGLAQQGAHVVCTERPQELGALRASLEAQQALKCVPARGGWKHGARASTRHAPGMHMHAAA